VQADRTSAVRSLLHGKAHSRMKKRREFGLGEEAPAVNAGSPKQG